MQVRLSWTAALAAVVGVVCPAIAVAEQRRPIMDHDKPVQCLRDLQGKLWRVQCDDATKVCLYAEDEELNSAGFRAKPLERARQCSHFGKEFKRGELEKQGYRFVQGRVDAPHGWTRDNRGRVFQINFDLRRRLYFGVKYTPEKVIGQELDSKRLGVDFGLFSIVTTTGKQNRTRHRMRLVEGEVRLEPFSAEVVLVHYDLSHKFIDPLLRITTFFGTPKRHDLHFNLGLWTEGGGLEIHHSGGARSSLWKFGAAQVTLDLWQSERIESFARLRTGLGVERLYTDAAPGDRTAITGASAFEVDWVIDRAGFHNLKFVASVEVPRYMSNIPGQRRTARRARARVNYEAIALAINDQPLSVTVGAGGERRNDVPGVADEWAFVADAGLRFSLWAPPRAKR